MEDLSPSLKLIWFIKRGAFEGHSVRWVVEQYLKDNKNSLSIAIKEKWLAESNTNWNASHFDKLEMVNQVLVEIILEGMEGTPIKPPVRRFGKRNKKK